jgi:hypothetical protein
MRAGARNLLFVTVAIPNVPDNVNAVDRAMRAIHRGAGGVKYPLLASGTEMEATFPVTRFAVALTGLRRLPRNWLTQ